MKKYLNSLINYIGRLFVSPSDRRIIDSINVRNIRSVYTFSVLTGIFDAVSLVLFSVTNRNNPGFLRTFFNVGFCVVTCVAIAVLSKVIIRKHEKCGTISNIKANALVTIFYMLLSAWGILVDVEHYEAGEQMLTFYIVQFCFVCFVDMLPKIGSIIIALSFSALYLTLYSVDGAANVQSQNYVLFALIAVFGNAMQYMILRESEKHKLDILELNLILQQEASVDDLTKLKNRNALRKDFDRNFGKSVYVIMADIDHFKSYNDTYGHVAGDTVLMEVATATKEAFQGGDAYRYGGDEFLVVIADCSEKEFEERIEKWKDLTQSILIPNITHAITCSFGYSRCVLNNSDDLRNAIKAADANLYDVKKQKAALYMP